MCVFIFPITWDRILKKEMVQAPGFEPTIFQLWVLNLTASANSFEKYKAI